MKHTGMVNDNMACILAAVHRMARRFAMRGAFEAEDIAQEAMVKVLVRKGEMPPGSCWLYKVVRSVAFDAGRKYSAERKYLQCVDHEEIFELVGDREQRGLDGSHQVHDLECEYVATRLRDALAELSPVLRQALLLYADGCSYEQIADLTKANIGTVRSRLHYARKKAQSLLTDLQ